MKTANQQMHGTAYRRPCFATFGKTRERRQMMFPFRRITMMLMCPIGIAMGLAGCISYTPGVIPVGPDTYSVTVTGNAFTTLGDVKAKAYQKAGAFCQQQGKVMMPVSVESTPQTAFSAASYDLTFRALNADDPEVRRPNLERAPDIKVDVHSK